MCIIMAYDWKKKKTSKIWQIFEPSDDFYGKCNICKARISYRTSISNLKKHFITRHGNLSLPEKRKKLQHNSSSSDQINEVRIFEPTAKIKKKQEPNFSEEIMKMSTFSLQRDRDSFEHLGLAWAAKLRKMQPSQSKFAERLISEVLFQGDMGMLSLDANIQTKPTSTLVNNCYSESSVQHANRSNNGHFSNFTQLSANSTQSTFQDIIQSTANQSNCLLPSQEMVIQKEEIVMPEGEILDQYEDTNTKCSLDHQILSNKL